MEQIEIIPTLIFAIVTTFTPGPNNIICTSMAAMYGYRKSLRFMIGIVSGFLIMMLLCGLFSQWLLATFPDLQPIIRYIGAAYILWLGYGVMRTTYAIEKQTELKPFGFLKGFVLQFLNPKAMVFGLTIYTVFLSGLSSPLGLLTSAIFFAFIAFSAISSWALLGLLFGRLLHNPTPRLIFNLILVALLVYTALEISGIFS